MLAIGKWEYIYHGPLQYNKTPAGLMAKQQAIWAVGILLAFWRPIFPTAQKKPHNYGCNCVAKKDCS